MPSFSVILPAAGKSSRYRDPHYKKPFAVLDDRPVWLHSAQRFLARSDVKQLIVIVSAHDREDFQSKFGPNIAIMGIQVVTGGSERADSVSNALEHIDPACDYVAIHDAARPCLVDAWIDKVFAAAVQHGAAILAVPVTETLKRSPDGKFIESTVPRERLWIGQTPQVFQRELLLRAYQQRGDSNPTDDAQLVEQLGHRVALVPGSPLNIKITTRGDLSFASACLRAAPKPKFDAPLHPFADDHLWR